MLNPTTITSPAMTSASWPADADGERACIHDQSDRTDHERDHVEGGKFSRCRSESGSSVGGESIERGEELRAGRGAELRPGDLGADGALKRRERSRRTGVVSVCGVRAVPFICTGGDQVPAERVLDRCSLNPGCRGSPGESRCVRGFVTHDRLCGAEVAGFVRECQRRQDRERRAECRHQRRCNSMALVSL